MDYEKEYIDLKIKYDKMETQKKKDDKKIGWMSLGILILIVALICQDQVINSLEDKAYDEGYEMGLIEGAKYDD